MRDKLVRVYERDGDGEANNARACEEYAHEFGLRRGQYEVRAINTPHTNTSQPYGLFVTLAAQAKIDHEQRQRFEKANGIA